MNNPHRNDLPPSVAALRAWRERYRHRRRAAQATLEEELAEQESEQWARNEALEFEKNLLDQRETSARSRLQEARSRRLGLAGLVVASVLSIGAVGLLVYFKANPVGAELGAILGFGIPGALIVAFVTLATWAEFDLTYWLRRRLDEETALAELVLVERKLVALANGEYRFVVTDGCDVYDYDYAVQYVGVDRR